MPAQGMDEGRAPAPHMLQRPELRIRLLLCAPAHYTNATGRGRGGWPEVCEAAGPLTGPLPAGRLVRQLHKVSPIE